MTLSLGESLSADRRFSTLTWPSQRRLLIGMVAAQRMGAQAFVFDCGCRSSSPEIILSKWSAIVARFLKSTEDILDQLSQARESSRYPSELTSFRPSVQPY